MTKKNLKNFGVDISEVLCERFYRRCVEPFDDKSVGICCYDRIMRPKLKKRIEKMSRLSKESNICRRNLNELRTASAHIQEYCDAVEICESWSAFYSV